MLHFSKGFLFSSVTAAAFTSLFMGGANPANAQNIIELSSPVASSAPKPIMVDVHRIVLLDVSDSMKPDEILAAFGGASAYYGSNELKLEQQSAICSANTVIFYGSYPKVMDTWILCDAEDTAKFRDSLSAIDIASVRIETDTSTLTTSLTDAFIAAGSVLKDEKGELNISSAQRNIVFVSDQFGGDDNGRIDQQRDALIAQYDVSISGIALEDEHLSQRFELHATSTRNVLENLGKTYISPGRVDFVETPVTDEVDARGQAIENAILRSFSLLRG